MSNNDRHIIFPGIIITFFLSNFFQVSTMKQGLLYLSQESCLIGDVSYHNYQGLLVEKDEWESLARDLGVHNKVMMLRNHGAICCGETIEEAFYYAYHLVLACDAQLKMVRYYYNISQRNNAEFTLKKIFKIS